MTLFGADCVINWLHTKAGKFVAKLETAVRQSSWQANSNRMWLCSIFPCLS